MNETQKLFHEAGVTKDLALDAIKRILEADPSKVNPKEIKEMAGMVLFVHDVDIINPNALRIPMQEEKKHLPAPEGD